MGLLDYIANNLYNTKDKNAQLSRDELKKFERYAKTQTDLSFNESYCLLNLSSEHKVGDTNLTIYDFAANFDGDSKGISLKDLQEVARLDGNPELSDNDIKVLNHSSYIISWPSNKSALDKLSLFKDELDVHFAISQFLKSGIKAGDFNLDEPLSFTISESPTKGNMIITCNKQDGQIKYEITSNGKIISKQKLTKDDAKIADYAADIIKYQKDEIENLKNLKSSTEAHSVINQFLKDGIKAGDFKLEEYPEFMFSGSNTKGNIVILYEKNGLIKYEINPEGKTVSKVKFKNSSIESLYEDKAGTLYGIKDKKLVSIEQEAKNTIFGKDGAIELARKYLEDQINGNIDMNGYVKSWDCDYQQMLDTLNRFEKEGRIGITDLKPDSVGGCYYPRTDKIDIDTIHAFENSKDEIARVIIHEIGHAQRRKGFNSKQEERNVEKEAQIFLNTYLDKDLSEEEQKFTNMYALNYTKDSEIYKDLPEFSKQHPSSLLALKNSISQNDIYQSAKIDNNPTIPRLSVLYNIAQQNNDKKLMGTIEEITGLDKSEFKVMYNGIIKFKNILSIDNRYTSFKTQNNNYSFSQIYKVYVAAVKNNDTEFMQTIIDATGYDMEAIYDFAEEIKNPVEIQQILKAFEIFPSLTPNFI